MQIIKYPSDKSVGDAIHSGDPLLVLISFDESEMIVSHIDEAIEHHILLARCGKDSRDIDKYFRVVVDDTGADWTFVCPSDYKGILDKTRRISVFYKDGFSAIAKGLQALGLYVGINIPRRYQRHIKELMN
ncbi:MAG: hypothetical protein SOR38_00130 [Oscillospiraceae bacterium]|nr:hypothetical protein [Oscillospiraceae bacterium]MDY3064199.1 hypothetical protein [Oscillospiraceae bacterium]